MEQFLGQDWEIVPAGGATGEAFKGQHGDGLFFLKRNTSPFLAVLSAEGIVPKLVWTKRLENGDVITAQEWLDGRELKPLEMGNEKVAKLLRKIHSSRPLLMMLRRLGKTPIRPANLLHSLQEEIDRELEALPAIRKAFRFLEKELPNVQNDIQVVCHCDVNHNNWLLSENNQLYLIDWDGAIIGDPAIDLGTMLYSYIPIDEWEDWIRLYGTELNDDLRLRMKWYFIVQLMFSIQWNRKKERYREMNKDLKHLLKIIENS